MWCYLVKKVYVYNDVKNFNKKSRTYKHIWDNSYQYHPALLTYILCLWLAVSGPLKDPTDCWSRMSSTGFKWAGSPVSARFHGPRNASGTGTGTGSGKMGSMLEIEQYYMVRVRDRIRYREVGVPNPVPDAMGPRFIASGNCVRVILYSICNPKSQNRSWKHFSDHVKPPLPGTPTSLIPDPDPDRGNEH